jgi:hypothetical protein
MPESQEEAPDDASTATQIPSNRGIVYVLTNQAMDNYVKVGRTDGNSSKRVLDRMKQLDNTSVPLPFDCEYAAVVDNYEKVEQSLLTAFEDRRVRNREFLYGVAPHRLKTLLQLLQIDDVTPRGSDVVDVPPVVDGGRKPKFKFSSARVPVGATLQWADDPQITCRVEDDTHILYQGKRATISGVAKERKGWTSAQGSRYWLYEEVTLQERREQVESEEEG